MNPKASTLLCLVMILSLATAPGQAWPARQAKASRAALSTQVIYADALGAGWDNWSWGADINLSAASPSPVHGGTSSLRVAYTASWGGLQLANPGGVSTTGFTQLRFFINGGSTGGQKINLYIELPDGTTQPRVALTPPVANQWSEVRVPLNSLGGQNKTITRVVWQDTSGGAQPAYYLDDISLADDSDPNGPVLSAGALHPRAIPADGATQVVVRATVSDPQGLGDVQSVTVDASALGRGTVALKDDGLNNDGASGDGQFGAVLTAAPGTPSQEVMVVISARDKGGHTSTLRLANLAVLAGPGGSIPGALPQRFGWGTNAWVGDSSADPAQDWQVKTGVPFDYLYQYITYGWEGWGDTFVKRFVEYAWAHSYVPVVTVYIMYGLPTTCGEGPDCYIPKLKNAASVGNYLATFQRAVQQASGSKPVIFNIEPDFYGYMQQFTNANPPAGIVKDDPASIPVALNRPGYSNTLAGFGRCLVDLIHTNAPNALAAPMASAWATNGDPHNVSVAEAIQMGQRTAAFIDKMGGAQADLLVVEWSDRDAGSGLRPWWDDTDMDLPRPTRALLWENALSTAAHKRLLLWQIPAGNMTQPAPGVPQHYQDNRSAYAFSHPRELVDTGVLGLAFGAGDSNQTQVWTDGDFIKAQAGIAYAAPAAPTGLQVVSTQGPVVTLGWNENSEPDLWGYQVSWQPAGGGAALTLDTRRRNSAALVLTAGSWEIFIRAYDAQGHFSPASIAVTAAVTVNPNLLYLPRISR